MVKTREEKIQELSRDVVILEDAISHYQRVLTKTKVELSKIKGEEVVLNDSSQKECGIVIGGSFGMFTP